MPGGECGQVEGKAVRRAICNARRDDALRCDCTTNRWQRGYHVVSFPLRFMQASMERLYPLRRATIHMARTTDGCGWVGGLRVFLAILKIPACKIESRGACRCFRSRRWRQGLDGGRGWHSSSPRRISLRIRRPLAPHEHTGMR